MEAKGAYNMHRYGDSGTYICDTLDNFNKLKQKDLMYGTLVFVKEVDTYYQFDGKEFIELEQPRQIKCTADQYEALGGNAEVNTLYNIVPSESTWSNVSINNTGVADIDFEVIFQEMAKRFNKVPITQHKCHNCGGTVKMDANKHIFKCPYCQSVYAIGTTQINSEV